MQVVLIAYANFVANRAVWRKVPVPEQAPCPELQSG